MHINILKIAIVLNVVRPYPGVFSDAVAAQIGGRLIDLIFLVLCLFSLFRSRIVSLPDRDGAWTATIASGICLYSLFAMLYGMFVSHYVADARDFYEPFRPILLLIAFLAFYNDSAFARKELWDRLWVGSLLLFAAVVAVKITDPPVLGQIASLLYGAAKDKFSAEGFVSRQTGFFSNPNWAGLFLAWSLAYFLFNFNLRRPATLGLILLNLVLIISTGSRTGLICSAFTIGMWLLFRMTLLQIMLAVAALFAVPLVAISLDVVNFLPKHLRELITAVVHGGSLMEVATFRIRVQVWKEALDNYFYTSPFIGRGPFKGDVLDVVDNQYVKWLVWYGSIGLGLMLLFYSYIIANAHRAGHEVGNRQFARGFVVMSMALLLAGMTGAFFDVTQLIFLYFAMFAGLSRMSHSVAVPAPTQGTVPLPRPA